MPFSVEEFRDLIRLLEERPEWRADLRRLVLTDELLALPSLVRRADALSGDELAALLERAARRAKLLAKAMVTAIPVVAGVWITPAAPQITRVAVLDRAIPWIDLLESLTAKAQALGVQLLRVEARDPSGLEGAFATMAASRADALLVQDDAMFQAHRHRIAELAATHRLPAMSRTRGFAQAGGLMQYGEDPIEQSRRAATYVDKILKGAKPADLPVEQAMKFELLINLKTAKALGLTLPPSLLFQADEVIQWAYLGMLHAVAKKWETSYAKCAEQRGTNFHSLQYLGKGYRATTDRNVVAVVTCD